MKFLIFLTICIHLVVSKPGVRIISGQLAKEAQFPFVAGIYVKRPEITTFCGGSLIDARWIVTAANCVINASQFTIILGTNTLTGKDSNRLTLRTATYYVDDKYNPDTLENNIALIDLKFSVVFSDHIQPINITTEATKDYVNVTAVGWGAQSEAGSLSDALRWVTLDTLPNDECQGIYGNSIIKSTVMCAAGNFNEGICGGDMGGPLIEIINGTPTLAGIASFISKNGCTNTDPSGYTRTAYFKGFIDYYLRQESF